MNNNDLARELIKIANELNKVSADDENVLSPKSIITRYVKYLEEKACPELKSKGAEDVVERINKALVTAKAFLASGSKGDFNESYGDLYKLTTSYSHLVSSSREWRHLDDLFGHYYWNVSHKF